MKVEDLTITDVYQFRQKEKQIRIQFRINDYQYSLVMNETSRTHRYMPNFIWHIPEPNHLICPLCQKEDLICAKLERIKKELFYYLIEQPAIRMEWLYLSYKV